MAQVTNTDSESIVEPFLEDLPIQRNERTLQTTEPY